MKILIDIGHAEGSGARGNGCEEHELCTVIGRELKAIFEARGDEAVVIDFPDMGNAGDLEATAREANRHGDAVCGISLHMDCAESAGARGGHVCYVSARGKELAEAVAGHLCALLPGRAERVVKRTGLYILKHTRAVWVLCECGFISNAGDCELAKGRPREVALAIARGVQEFLRTSNN